MVARDLGRKFDHEKILFERKATELSATEFMAMDGGFGGFGSFDRSHVQG
ncbi:MAG: hypothetical protein ABIY40_06810 [Rhodanobacteraceae bacterium]